MNEIRGYLRFGSNNLVHESQVDFRFGAAGRACVEIAALTNILNRNASFFNVYTKLNYLAIKKYGYGQCNEQAQAVFFRLLQNQIYPLEFVNTKLGQHNLIIINRDPTTNIKEVSSWNENCWVCDPWVDRIYPINELEKVRKDTLLGLYNPCLYQNDLLPSHYLNGEFEIQHGVKNHAECLIFFEQLHIAHDSLKLFEGDEINEVNLNENVRMLSTQFRWILEANLPPSQILTNLQNDIQGYLNFIQDNASDYHPPPKRKS